MELCLKKDLYFDNAYLKTLTGLDDYKEKMLDSSFDTSSSIKGVSKEKRQQIAFETGVTTTIKPSKYSNMWHIFAVSNVTVWPISSIYPEVSCSLVSRLYLNVNIVPEKVRQSDVVYLMWTHTQNTSLRGWSPNHFVPLMPIDSAQVTPQSPNTSSSGQPPSSPSSSQAPKAAQKRNATGNHSTKDPKKKYRGSFLYSSHFLSSWTQQWPCIVASSKSSSHFFCTVCQRTLSCAKQGVRDVKMHIGTALHEKNCREMKTQKTLLQTCASHQNTCDKVYIFNQNANKRLRY